MSVGQSSAPKSSDTPKRALIGGVNKVPRPYVGFGSIGVP